MYRTYVVYIFSHIEYVSNVDKLCNNAKITEYECKDHRILMQRSPNAHVTRAKPLHR